MTSAMFLFKDVVWVILSGCKHEGYRVVAAHTNPDSARGAWANLKGKEPGTDHALQAWRGNTLVGSTQRNRDGSAP
jgi:hypothetical protein